MRRKYSALYVFKAGFKAGQNIPRICLPCEDSQSPILIKQCIPLNLDSVSCTIYNIRANNKKYNLVQCIANKLELPEQPDQNSPHQRKGAGISVYKTHHHHQFKEQGYLFTKHRPPHHHHQYTSSPTKDINTYHGHGY